MTGPRPTPMPAVGLGRSSALTVRLHGRTLRPHNREAIPRRHASLLRRGRTRRRLAVLPRRDPLQATVRTVAADRAAEETAAATRVAHHTGAANRVRNLRFP
jgi:hypothetical protein